MADKDWASYEEVAVYLLNRFAEHFGLGRVHGKSIVAGAGTKWELDGIGYSQDGAQFVIVECKRYTKSKVDQETMGGLAFRILRTGASGGIVVTPIGYQAGAANVADHERITRVMLNQDCTTTEYVMRFFDQVQVGLADTVTATDSVSIQLIKADGTIENYGPY